MRLTLTFNSLAAMGNVVGQGGYNTAADVASTDTGRHASPSDSVASDSLSAYSSVIYVRQGRHQTPLTRQLDPPPASSLPAETLMTIFRMLEPQMPEHPTWHDRTLVYEFRQSLAQVGGVCRTWARASRGVQELIAIVTGTRSAHKLVKRRETRGPRLHSVVIDLDTGFKLTSLVKMCMPVLYLLGYDVAFLSDASYEQMDTPISPHCRALSIKRPYTRSIQFVAEASSGTRLGRLQSLDFGRQIGSEASYRIAAAGLLALAPDIRSLRLQLDESFRTGHTFFRTVARSTQQLTHLTLLDPACAQITALCRLLPGNAPVLPPEDPEAANRWPNLRHLTISVLPGELSHMHQPFVGRIDIEHTTIVVRARPIIDASSDSQAKLQDQLHADCIAIDSLFNSLFQVGIGSKRKRLTVEIARSYWLLQRRVAKAREQAAKVGMIFELVGRDDDGAPLPLLADELDDEPSFPSSNSLDRLARALSAPC